MQSSLKRLSAAMLLLLVIVGVVHAAGLHSELPRFHQVSERLYRGGQFRQGGIARLASLGINTIINLRGPGEHTRADEAEAKSWGLNYFNIPLPVWGRPNDAAVLRVMEIITAPESGRVFIHCKDGVDRTGMIVALHRITSEGWSTNAATAEAERLGMRRYQYWMRDYISDYPIPQHLAVKQQYHRHADTVDGDMKDKIGAGARVGERAAFRAKKTSIRVVRSARAAVNGFLGKVF